MRNFLTRITLALAELRADKIVSLIVARLTLSDCQMTNEHVNSSLLGRAFKLKEKCGERRRRLRRGNTVNKQMLGDSRNSGCTLAKDIVQLEKYAGRHCP